MESNVRTLAGGTPLWASILLIVAIPTPDKEDSSATVILSIDLAALICSLVIKSNSLYNKLFSIIY